MKLALLFLLLPLDAAAECSAYQLFAKERLQACTPSECIDITAMPKGARPIEAAPPPRAEWDLRTRKVCFGTTCRAPGAKLAAELVRRGKLASGIRHHEIEVGFTIDHELAVVVGPVPNPLEIWDVAKDQRLAIKPSNDHPNAKMSTATVVGSAIIVDWNDGLASVHDRKNQRGKTFRAGLIAPLDDTRAAVIGWTGTVTTIELATGTLLRSDPLINARVPFETEVLYLDPQGIALLWSDDAAVIAARIFVPRDAAPTLAKQTVATCK